MHSLFVLKFEEKHYRLAFFSLIKPEASASACRSRRKNGLEVQCGTNRGDLQDPELRLILRLLLRSSSAHKSCSGQEATPRPRRDIRCFGGHVGVGKTIDEKDLAPQALLFFAKCVQSDVHIAKATEKKWKTKCGLSLVSGFSNRVLFQRSLWLFRSWGKSFFPVPAGPRSKTRPRRARAGF